MAMAGTMPDPTANVNMLKASGVSPQLASPCLSLVYALGPRWGSTGQVFSKLASNSQKLGWWGRGGGGPVLTRATSAPSSGQSGQSGQRAHTRPSWTLGGSWCSGRFKRLQVYASPRARPSFSPSLQGKLELQGWAAQGDHLLLSIHTSLIHGQQQKDIQEEQD